MYILDGYEKYECLPKSYFHVSRFIYKIKHDTNPSVFAKVLKEIHHNYPNRISENSFKQPKAITKTTSFAISSHGPKIWSNYLMKIKRRFYTYHYLIKEKTTSLQKYRLTLHKIFDVRYFYFVLILGLRFLTPPSSFHPVIFVKS